jgi:hypothetical protein
MLLMALFAAAQNQKFADTKPEATAAPAMIGAEHPVFLGRITVVAPASPDDPRQR